MKIPVAGVRAQGFAKSVKIREIAARLAARTE